MNNIDNLIKNLNKEQKEAVLSTEGPNLIVAGAGSGKTRVLTTRLIHIINEKKAWPNQILCVTFTNKAAKEMQNRVMQYIKGNSNAVPWLGTFHSISVKLLRRHAEALDYKSNFSILDTEEKLNNYILNNYPEYFKKRKYDNGNYSSSKKKLKKRKGLYVDT